MFIWNGKCIKNNLYCICLFWWPRLELLTLKSKRIFFDLCIPTCITPGPNLIISQHCSWGRSSCRHAAQTANAKTLLKNWSVRQCRCEHLKPVVCFNHCFPYFLESCVGEIFTWKHIRVESLIHMEVYNWHAFKTHVQTVKPDKQLQTHLWAAALSRPNKLKMEKKPSMTCGYRARNMYLSSQKLKKNHPARCETREGYYKGACVFTRGAIRLWPSLGF